ncbi:DUF3196 family protein [Desertibacillus haloalkaliphilus]|uniref:DUF3196 family protein n=1 Tax=Desertibacillus haloalkaliphilus TaxID=1328930 RepID=UPI001C27385A|nr:DUF3196 family protein [Desertibacillus haloalkaliphilus]MBU8905078.1 tetratricopeptide repeat protein [Desertibacillus haloalkaliphilus]
MGDDQSKRTKENVVLFPGLINKLVEKGMDSLKEKHYTQALSYFRQSLEVEPNHAQGRFGEVLSLIELGRLNEAKEASETMLKEDIGDYYDVLQVHVSLLVQLSKYDEVVTMLEAIIAEDKLPPHLAESFYQLLHFSRQMVEAEAEPSIEIDREADELSVDAIDVLLEQLNSHEPNLQWHAIQQLGNVINEHVLAAFYEFLKVEENDPILKTMVLQMIKEEGIDDTVTVHKFDQTISIKADELEDVLHSELGLRVLNRLSEEVEHENPSLYEMMVELWWHYLIALYPLTPTPEDKDLWAAAIHMAGLESIGSDYTEEEIAKTYDQPIRVLLEKTEEITTVNKQVFQWAFKL